MEQFLVPAGEGASEYTEKKSRFLGLIVPVTTEAEARARLEAVKSRNTTRGTTAGPTSCTPVRSVTATTASRRARPVSRF